MALHVPEFIKGVNDPSDDGAWNTWVKMMNKYGHQKFTDIVQPYLDAHPLILESGEVE